MSLCPQCNGPIPAGEARFCIHCGSPLGDTSNARATELAAPLAMLFIQHATTTRAVRLGVKTLTFGRDPVRDVVIDAGFVSKRHCQIAFEKGAHQLTDLGSRNGLTINGRRVESHTLAHGDVVRITDAQTGGFVSLSYQMTEVPTAPVPATIKRVEVPRELSGVVFGRAGADVLFEHPQVSRKHAQASRRDDGAVILRDLDSANGTFVNGRRISAPTALTPGDVVRIGPFRLAFDGRGFAQEDERRAVRIDAESLTRRAHEKTILNDVSLTILPREFVALVGGSGAGKSTLLGALSGHSPADEGVLSINGEVQSSGGWRASMGYVPQDDILHRALSVQRALEYSARLRLPEDTSDDEIARRVERVLDAVDMARHRHTVIDALSGGQRKRVSIAAELLADPALFFLDEPTSGLDPGLEKKLMFTLRALADEGRTVVLVTHATANITCCDHVAFMADGLLVYFGPPTEALSFFGVTTGDFADIYSRLDGEATDDAELVKRELAAEHAAWRREHGDSAAPPRLSALWQRRFLASPAHQKYVALRRRSRPSERAVADDALAPTATSPIGRGRQFAVLASRYLRLVAADRRNLAVMLAQAPAVAAILLLVAPRDALTGAGATSSEARKVLMMAVLAATWFGILSAAREITKERAVLRRERLAGLSVGPYVASKFAVLLALTLAQNIALWLFLAVGMDIPRNGVLLLARPELFVTTALSSLAGVGLGLCLSALAATPDRAMSLVPVLLIPQIVFAGSLFPLDGMSRLASWLTTARWALDAAGSTVDLNGLPVTRGGPSWAQLYGPERAYTATVEHVVRCWAYLAGQCAGWLAITWVALRRLV